MNKHFLHATMFSIRAPAPTHKVRFTYTGEENIPSDATHIFVLARVIPRQAFRRHRNVVKVVCHKRVKKIEEEAFYWCRCLRRVKMHGVKVMEGRAFSCCPSLTDVECGKLERIGAGAFCGCESLRSINLPSARIVKRGAFRRCDALVDAKFGNKLERIGGLGFADCPSLWNESPSH